jgi:two-component system, sensor histidine kinase and response regulator
MTNPLVSTIDWQELLARVENDADLAREILSIFQSDAPSYREALRHAVETQNAEEVRKAAHAFKGMLANLSANSASQMAAQLEQLGKTAKTAEMAAAWRDFEDELLRVLRDTEHLLAGASE